MIVTGANGFIGSHLVNRLGENVVCCDPRNNLMISPFDLVSHIRDSTNVDCVYHLGAISSTTEVDLTKLTYNNILFSCQLMDICVQKKIPFVYASSASVYGSGAIGFSEDVAMAPMNYYAISKASFDYYARQKAKDNPDSKIVGLRYFNVYGKNEDHKGDMASPIHKFLKQAMATSQIKIFEGSEMFLRDFVHVDDVVSITIAAKDFKESGIYNVGTGVPRSFLEVADIISEKTNAKIVEIPFPTKLLGKYQAFTCSDNNKINSSGYTTDRKTLEDGIMEVMND
jgi:ADP-L-glycero-D-manno-heptose 6-epimerase